MAIGGSPAANSIPHSWPQGLRSFSTFKFQISDTLWGRTKINSYFTAREFWPPARRARRAYPARGSVSSEQRSPRPKEPAGKCEVVFARPLWNTASTLPLRTSCGGQQLQGKHGFTQREIVAAQCRRRNRNRSRGVALYFIVYRSPHGHAGAAAKFWRMTSLHARMDMARKCQ